MQLDAGTDQMLGEISAIVKRLVSKGAFEECLPMLERSHEIKTRLHGSSSESAFLEKLELANVYYNMATSILHPNSGEHTHHPTKIHKHQIATAKSHLKHADSFTTLPRKLPRAGGNSLDFSSPTQQKRIHLRSAVLHELTCVYKQEGHLRAALQVADKALQLQDKHEGLLDKKAATLLNIAALYSGLGKHELALQHAVSALDVVLIMEDESFHNCCLDLAAQVDPPPASPEIRDRIFHSHLQMVCYLDIATEHEHLNQLEAALENYQIAYKLAYMSVGPDDNFTLRAKQGYADVLKKAVKKK